MNTPTRTRLTRGQSQQQTRQRLIETACRQVAERGFVSASVRDIAEAAGYSQGAFYSNFESKESLLLEVLKIHKDKEANRIAAIVKAAGEDFEATLAGLEAWAKQFVVPPDQALLASELQLHAVRSPEFGAVYRAFMLEQRANCIGILGRLFELSGTKPPAPLEDIAGGLMTLSCGLAIDKAIGGSAEGNVLPVFLRALFRT